MNRAAYLFEQAGAQIEAGHSVAALDTLAQAIQADQSHAAAWAMRGLLEHEAGRAFNALLHYNMATRLAPDRDDIWSNFGLVLAGTGQIDNAEKAYLKSLEIGDNFPARCNLGSLYMESMRPDEALVQFRRGLELRPDDPQMHTNIGACLIMKGEWREGFAEHRHRFRFRPAYPPRPRLDYPIWRGEDIRGKTVMLHSEQGFGDEIMALRFAQSALDMGAHVIVSVRPQVYRLALSHRFKAGADRCSVITTYDPPPRPVDYLAALLDVPAFVDDLGSDPLTLAAGYLKVPDRGFKLDLPKGFRVGICWASGKRPNQPATDKMAAMKTLPFDALAPLARRGVVLVSLQQSHGDRDAMAALGVVDAMGGIQDFADTAWLIDQLDLVITVDTSVAHLAGALGKPVWNLVRWNAYWPWTLEGLNGTSKTCWYDSMTLYRQPKLGDWKTPLARLMSDFDRNVAGIRKAA